MIVGWVCTRCRVYEITTRLVPEMLREHDGMLFRLRPEVSKKKTNRKKK